MDYLPVRDEQSLAISYYPALQPVLANRAVLITRRKMAQTELLFRPRYTNIHVISLAIPHIEEEF